MAVFGFTDEDNRRTGRKVNMSVQATLFLFGDPAVLPHADRGLLEPTR